MRKDEEDSGSRRSTRVNIGVHGRRGVVKVVIFRSEIKRRGENVYPFVYISIAETCEISVFECILYSGSRDFQGHEGILMIWVNEGPEGKDRS